MLDTQELWDTALADIENQITRATYVTWFKPTHAVKTEGGTLYLGVPSKLAKDWFASKYNKLVLKAIRGITEDIRSVEYVVAERKTGDKSTTSKIQPKQPTGVLPLEEHYINRETNLNPQFTFDMFVVGSFNELAHAAGQAVLSGLGTVYNPLFIYGKTGHGKTHLIQAIGNAVSKKYNHLKPYYVTSERFTQDYVNSVQTNRVHQFKERYRKYDVLIMDDIQFLSGKDKTQEELFHLFDTMVHNRKQIVFSSDQHPNYIPGLEERLQSRFQAGMLVDIPTPDRESRMAILKNKAERNNYEIPTNTLDYLASSIDGNIRQLEGALNAIICQTQLKGGELSLSEIQRLIKNSVRPKKMVSMDEVISVVSNFYNIEEENIYKKTRKKEIVRPRQIIMYILREDYAFAFPTIGQKLGGRDHTTVIHSYERIKEKLKNDSTLSQEIDQIRGVIQ